MVRKAEIPQHAIDTALRLAAERGWARLSYGEIAEAAGLPLSKLHPLFPSKGAILAGFQASIDAAVVAEQEAEAAGPAGETDKSSARDRLFDVMMSRYDALRPYREGLGNILYDALRDPCLLASLLPAQRRSMALMLELAGLPSSGLAGLLRIKGLTAIHMATLRDWLRDDSLDLSKTMAALDGHLRRVESLLGRLGRGRAGGGPAAEDAAGDGAGSVAG